MHELDITGEHTNKSDRRALTGSIPYPDYARSRTVACEEVMSRTVAVVEDDSDILDLVREVLEIDGFEVAMFDAPDVVKIVEMEPAPALFLIDLMLPGMTGVELAAHLRSSAYPETPMIAMSASRLMLEMASSSELFQHTIAKPFNLSTLLSLVEDWTSNGNGNGNGAGAPESAVS